MLRILVILANSVLLLVGLALVAIGALLKWTDVIEKVEALDVNVQDVIDDFDTLIVFYLVIGIAFCVVSVMGFIAGCCANKWIVIVYEIVVFVLFVAHLVFFIYYITQKDNIVNDLNKTIQAEVDEIISNGNIEFEESFECSAYASLADTFDCCDFNSTTIYYEVCCPSGSDKPCTDAIIDLFWDFAVILPNVILIVVEFFILAAVALVIIDLYCKALTFA